MASAKLNVDERALGRAIRKAKDEILADVSTAVVKHTYEAQTTATNRVPVAFGEIKQNIGTRFATTSRHVLTGTIESRAQHSPFLEFGTGPLGSSSNLGNLAREAMQEAGYSHGPEGGFPPKKQLQRWLRLKGLDEGLWFPIAMKIRREGSKAQPFLYPSVEEQAEPLSAAITSALRKDRA